MSLGQFFNDGVEFHVADRDVERTDALQGVAGWGWGWGWGWG